MSVFEDIWRSVAERDKLKAHQRQNRIREYQPTLIEVIKGNGHHVPMTHEDIIQNQVLAVVRKWLTDKGVIGAEEEMDTFGAIKERLVERSRGINAAPARDPAEQLDVTRSVVRIHGRQMNLPLEALDSLKKFTDQRDPTLVKLLDQLTEVIEIERANTQRVTAAMREQHARAEAALARQRAPDQLEQAVLEQHDATQAAQVTRATENITLTIEAELNRMLNEFEEVNGQNIPFRAEMRRAMDRINAELMQEIGRQREAAQRAEFEGRRERFAQEAAREREGRPEANPQPGPPHPEATPEALQMAAEEAVREANLPQPPAQIDRHQRINILEEEEDRLEGEMNRIQTDRENQEEAGPMDGETQEAFQERLEEIDNQIDQRQDRVDAIREEVMRLENLDLADDGELPPAEDDLDGGREVEVAEEEDANRDVIPEQ